MLFLQDLTYSASDWILGSDLKVKVVFYVLLVVSLFADGLYRSWLFLLETNWQFLRFGQILIKT